MFKEGFSLGLHKHVSIVPSKSGKRITLEMCFLTKMYFSHVFPYKSEKVISVKTLFQTKGGTIKKFSLWSQFHDNSRTSTRSKSIKSFILRGSTMSFFVNIILIKMSLHPLETRVLAIY